MTNSSLEHTPAEASEPSAPILEIRDLQVEFQTTAGIVRPLEGVSLAVAPGETLAVLGESGSGKSVTAQAVMGLLPKHSGRITGGQILYRNTDLVPKPIKYVRKLCGKEIAMIFQDPLSSLNPVFTVGYQIAEPLRRRRGLNRRKAREEAIHLMDRVGIPESKHRVDDFPHQFSGGMRQRVMIALALALRPTVLIADEPTTALDVTVQAQIMDLLAEIQEETGMGMVLITHDLGVVAGMAQRAAIMYSGRVIETGPIRDVYDNPAHPYTEGLLHSIPGETEARLTPIEGVAPNPLDPPPGCPFAPRCPYAQAACTAEVPALRRPKGWPAHQKAACIRTEEVLSNVRG